MSEFKDKFSSGYHTVMYIAGLVWLFSQADRAGILKEVISQLDEKYRRAYYPPPTHEEFEAYADRCMRLKPWEMPPIPPGTPRDLQLLPQPIFTNISWNNFQLVVQRVYGGVLKAEEEERCL